MVCTRERDTDIWDGVYEGEGYRYLVWRLQGRGIQISGMVCTTDGGVQISSMASTRERDTDI